MEEKKDRLTELLSDESFMKKLFSQETPEKAQEILKENGVDMPVEEVFIMGEHDGELPDELTEQVAGGLDLSSLANQLGGLPYAVQGFVAMIEGFSNFLSGWNDPKIGKKALETYYNAPDFMKTATEGSSKKSSSSDDE